MTSRALRAALAVALMLMTGALSASAAFVIDGLGDDWGSIDVIGVSTRAPTDGNATLDLKSLSAGDNSTDWFFRVTFDFLLPGENATVALYLFGPESGAPSQSDPRGYAVALPAGAPLSYAIYFEVVPGFPSGSSVSFFDGALWKNRTFAELGLTAARNDTAAFVELAAPRAGLAFLQAGFAAAALLAPSAPSGPLTVIDAVPDNPAPPPGAVSSRVRFYDYTLAPPIVLTALGVSDPAAVEGDTTTVFAELTNTGPKTASGVTGRITIDGAVLGSTSGLTLLPSGTHVLSFPWQLTAGHHNVTAQSFPGGASNSIALNVIGASAELSIFEASAKPATPAPGESFSVEVRVRNDGNAASGASQLLLKDGTLVLASAPLPSIGPGQTTTVSLPASITRSGTAVLRVEIDGVNSANSTAQVSVAVSAPQPPFGIPALAWLVIGVGACGAAAWLLTPGLKRRRKSKEP